MKHTYFGITFDATFVRCSHNQKDWLSEGAARWILSPFKLVVGSPATARFLVRTLHTEFVTDSTEIGQIYIKVYKTHLLEVFLDCIWCRTSNRLPNWIYIPNLLLMQYSAERSKYLYASTGLFYPCAFFLRFTHQMEDRTRSSNRKWIPYCAFIVTRRV